MACARELGLDEDKLNVNGGAIAIGHPLGATGVRLAITLARELKRSQLRYGIASACIGGGQGIALLIENPDDATAGTEELIMDIKGHAAIVTGGASGLGAATAERACAAPAPRSPASTSISTARSAVADKIGGIAVALRRHRRRAAPRPRSPRRAASTASRRILVNCAGIGPAKRIVGRDGPMPLDEFERVINDQPDRHLQHDAARRRRHAGPEPLADGERGVIVSTASVAAFEGQIGQAAYAASKGGVAALTMPAAREFAQFGIRVNADRARHFPHADADGAAARRRRRASAPRCRSPSCSAGPTEFAELVRHIIENSYLNGEVIRLDGALRMAPR